MKGDIFSIFEKFIAKNFGQEVFEQAFEKASPMFITKQPFVAPEVYPDSDFMHLLSCTLELINVPVQQAMLLFGRFAFGRLAATIPALVSKYSNSIELLRDLDGIIHLEVRKLRRGTNPPRLLFTLLDNGDVELLYESKRQLHDLAEGLLRGCADHFGEQVDIKRELSGDGRCIFRLHYER